MLLTQGGLCPLISRLPEAWRTTDRKTACFFYLSFFSSATRLLLKTLEANSTSWEVGVVNLTAIFCNILWLSRDLGIWCRYSGWLHSLGPQGLGGLYCLKHSFNLFKKAKALASCWMFLTFPKFAGQQLIPFSSMPLQYPNQAQSTWLLGSHWGVSVGNWLICQLSDPIIRLSSMFFNSLFLGF